MPNPVYPEIKLYIDLDNDNVTETDISSRIVSAFDGESGIFTYKDTDRLANVGSLRFEIDNSDGTYTNFGSFVGKAVSVRLVLGSREKQVWFGYIKNAMPDSGEWGERRILVTALDWISIGNETRVQNIPLATFVTGDEAIPTLLDATPNPPAFTNFEAGYETFPNMFDGALQKTTVYSELDKITKSELGYLYLRFRNTSNGETLRFEDYLHRGSTHPLSEVPENIVSPFHIKWANASDSGNVKWRNASDSGLLLLPTFQQAYFNRTMVDSDWEIGQNVINQMSVNQIPRHTDTSLVTLWSLGSPISIGTSQKHYFNGGWTDPNGGTVISAFDFQTPVASVDYIFNEESDGSGANLSANLILVYFPSVNGFTLGFFNAGPPGYLILAVLRGKGIYKYNPVETLSENIESQEEIVKTVVSDAITREYSNNYSVSKTFADGVVAINRTPIKVMKSVSFIGNTSEHLMLAFMFLDIGDKVQIVESEPSHTGNYYIQGIKFKLDVNGIVYFTWYLKEDVETICEPIAVSVDVGGVDAIDFGILPYLANLPAFSYSFWIRLFDALAGYYPITRSVDPGDGNGRRGHEILINKDQKVTFYSYKTPTDGEWRTTNVVLPSTDTWYHVVITYDNTTDTADPIIYVDGASVAVTELGTPSGTSDNDSDCPLILFNNSFNPNTPSQEYMTSVDNFVLKDVRVYNKILTPAEVLEINNGEDDYSTVSEGKLFNGIYAPKDNIADYINDTILADDWVLDSVHMAVGIPYNHDTSNDDYILHGESL
jgi:hypothetical protein